MTFKNILKYKFPSIVLLISLVVSIFLLFFSASVSYRQFRSVLETQKWVVHSHKVTNELTCLLAILIDAETAQRGYLLTRDSLFLKSYNDAIDKKKDLFINLKKLTVNNITQNQNLDTLNHLIDERFHSLSAVLDQFTDEGLVNNKVKSLLLSGKTTMDKIKVKASQMKAIEAIVLKNCEANHANEISASPISYLLTSIISLIIFLVAYYKIFKDIRELKQANNQLLINKRLFEQSEKISNICNWCWNLEANIITFSNNIYNMLRCDAEDFEPTVDGYNKFVHPEDRHIITDGAKRLLNELETSTVYYRVIRKDGELCYFRSSSKLIKDNYNKCIRIGVITDISEQYHNNKILEDKLFDLERSNKELLAFNHVASHDLQEPLRKIQTFISRFSEKELDSLTENGKNYFSRITAAANRMQILIDDLLSFSRANKADKAFELMDLNLLLDSSQQEMAQLIEDKHATINSETLPTLKVIPFQIKQLFSNLIGNALKYSNPNVLPVITITSEIICGKDVIKSSFISENQLHKISVSDNGIGFEQKYAEEIFILFNRLHNDTEYTGTGIGLTICKKIAENHKGFITAESIPNVGSRFNIFFPVAN